MLLFAMIATVLIFAVSLVLLIAAALLYVPLLCYIQGNLKVRLSYFLSLAALCLLTLFGTLLDGIREEAMC